MKVFAETSFLFAFYFPRSQSERAIGRMESQIQAPLISPLVSYEFHQAVWFEVWRARDLSPRGLNETSAQSALAAFTADLERGVWSLETPRWDAVFRRAERLTLAYTPRRGARAMDLLHLATALERGATEFLSFDERLCAVAEAEGITLGR